MDINAYDCPQCRRTTDPRYTVPDGNRLNTWYVCPACRHAWRCVAIDGGQLRAVTAQSPHREPLDKSALWLRSPCCERGSRIKQTMAEEGRVVRRHECRECSQPFYTVTSDEGLVTVLPRRPVPLTRAVEL